MATAVDWMKVNGKLDSGSPKNEQHGRSSRFSVRISWSLDWFSPHLGRTLLLECWRGEQTFSVRREASSACGSSKIGTKSGSESMICCFSITYREEWFYILRHPSWTRSLQVSSWSWESGFSLSQSLLKYNSPVLKWPLLLLIHRLRISLVKVIFGEMMHKTYTIH